MTKKATLPPSVRMARFQLAQALVAEGSRDDAIDQMLRVLNHPGPNPPNSSVYAELSRTHEARNDPASALEFSVRAVAENPAGSDCVRRAFELIERFPESAGDVPKDILRRLEAQIRSFSKARSAWLLAAQLRLQRGEYGKALEFLHAAPKDRSCATTMRIAEANLALGRAAEARKSLGRAAKKAGLSPRDDARLHLLLSRAEAETGHYAEGLAGLPAGDSPEHAFVRALACVGRGQLAEAQHECENQTSIDTSLLLAAIHIHRKEFEDARAQALRVASESAASIDVLLVRAQIELESAANIEEGCALLEQAFATMETNLARSRWPALQKPFARDRASFRYFLAESAEASGDPEALALAEAVDRSGTESAQDGRLDLIRGRHFEQHGHVDRAAEAFGEAALSFESGNLLPAAIDAAGRAFAISRSGAAAADLASLLWRASFREASKENRTAYLQEAAELTESDAFPEESGDDSDRLVYYAGLVTFRTMELGERDRWVRGWNAVLPLMAAFLNSERDPYRARFLAEALNAVGANGAATAFAERAFEWGPDDDTRETAVVARGNYYRGVAHVEPLLNGGFEDMETFGTWSEGVRLNVAVDSGEQAELRKLVAGTLFDGPWTRLAEAKAVAVLDGSEKARPLFRRVAEEMSEKRGDEHSAALVWLSLGDAQAAQRCLDEGTERKNIPLRPGAWVQALLDLVSERTEDAAVALECVSHLPPIQIGEAFFVTLPMLQKLHTKGAVARALDVLVRRLRERVDAIVDEPTILDGLEDAPDGMRPLLLAMARLIDAAERGTGITQAIDTLHALEPAGRLGRVLDQASQRLVAAVGAEARPATHGAAG